jgi:hypothetical protein
MHAWLLRVSLAGPYPCSPPRRPESRGGHHRQAGSGVAASAAAILIRALSPSPSSARWNVAPRTPRRLGRIEFVREIHVDHALDSRDGLLLPGDIVRRLMGPLGGLSRMQGDEWVVSLR